jgi:two-component system nitrogen regulation sensor histidine kinase NtrY
VQICEALPVNNARGQELFRIKLKPGRSFIAYDAVTIFLRVLSVIFLLVFLHSVAQELVRRYRFKTGFFFAEPGYFFAIDHLLVPVSFRFQ